jgi:hypothetical protein
LITLRIVLWLDARSQRENHNEEKHRAFEDFGLRGENPGQALPATRKYLRNLGAVHQTTSTVSAYFSAA